MGGTFLSVGEMDQIADLLHGELQVFTPNFRKAVHINWFVMNPSSGSALKVVDRKNVRGHAVRKYIRRELHSLTWCRSSLSRLPDSRARFFPVTSAPPTQSTRACCSLQVKSLKKA